MAGAGPARSSPRGSRVIAASMVMPAAPTQIFPALAAFFSVSAGAMSVMASCAR